MHEAVAHTLLHNVVHIVVLFFIAHPFNLTFRFIMLHASHVIDLLLIAWHCWMRVGGCSLLLVIGRWLLCAGSQCRLLRGCVCTGVNLHVQWCPLAVAPMLNSTCIHVEWQLHGWWSGC